MSYENKTILITGGSGSWGNELTKELLELNPKQIIIYSRNEFLQVSMRRKFNNPKLKFIIGDVRNSESLEEATKGVDIVFHLAALKHIELCEEQPWETILTNIIGTQNVINSAIKNNINKVVDVSTDKSCAPINLYGLTKGVGEKLIIQANNRTDETTFTCIKSGNVMGTNGSVIHYFIDQLKKDNIIRLTDKRMTRFFLTLPQAIKLLLVASKSNLAGGTFVVKMPSCRLMDLANIIIKYYGNSNSAIEEIGIRPGEKIHESLISRDEVEHTYVYDSDYYLIAPILKINRFEEKFRRLNLEKVDFDEYNSNQSLMSLEEIESMLKQGGFLNG